MLTPLSLMLLHQGLGADVSSKFQTHQGPGSGPASAATTFPKHSFPFLK